MKTKITRKELRERFIVYNIGCYDLQHLLTMEEPTYYATRAEGWAFDVYVFGNVALVNGYAPIGEKVDRKLIEKYEKKARSFLDKTRGTKSWQYKETILHRWINKLIEEL